MPSATIILLYRITITLKLTNYYFIELVNTLCIHLFKYKSILLHSQWFFYLKNLILPNNNQQLTQNTQINIYMSTRMYLQIKRPTRDTHLLLVFCLFVIQ